MAGQTLQARFDLKTSGTGRRAAVGRRAVGAPRRQRLIALFGAACLLFNFPLLALWNREAVVLGVPLFPVALFTIWGALIALLAWIVEKADDQSMPDQ